MRKLLITGFDAFGKGQINPARKLLKALEQSDKKENAHGKSKAG